MCASVSLCVCVCLVCPYSVCGCVCVGVSASRQRWQQRLPACNKPTHIYRIFFLCSPAAAVVVVVLAVVAFVAAVANALPAPPQPLKTNWKLPAAVRSLCVGVCVCEESASRPSFMSARKRERERETMRETVKLLPSNCVGDFDFPLALSLSVHNSLCLALFLFWLFVSLRQVSISIAITILTFIYTLPQTHTHTGAIKSATQLVQCGQRCVYVLCSKATPAGMQWKFNCAKTRTKQIAIVELSIDTSIYRYYKTNEGELNEEPSIDTAKSVLCDIQVKRMQRLVFTLSIIRFVSLLWSN